MSSNLAEWEATLLNKSESIAKRTQVSFLLRTEGSVDAVHVLGNALRVQDDSALLRHELAYILGQMQRKEAVPVLTEVLTNDTDDCMVRHEAAEALGALVSEESLPLLDHYTTDESTPLEVQETCLLAAQRIRWALEQQGSEPELDQNPYHSVDPTPPAPKTVPTSELREQLLDSSLPLFVRYRAMFSLRNRGDAECVDALVAGFQDASSLFRHEVAYVLGQVQSPLSVDGLSEVVNNESEHRMVRHEAAEALGAIGGEKAESVLGRFLRDAEDVVRESCEVALDMAECWDDNNDQNREGGEQEEESSA
jgi:deoxyhypusine monooxygenase